MSNNLEKSSEITNNDDNSSIVSFILEYTELYINHKKSCNVAKNTIYNTSGILLGLAATGLCINQDIFAYKWL